MKSGSDELYCDKLLAWIIGWPHLRHSNVLLRPLSGLKLSDVSGGRLTVKVQWWRRQRRHAADEERLSAAVGLKSSERRWNVSCFDSVGKFSFRWNRSSSASLSWTLCTLSLPRGRSSPSAVGSWGGSEELRRLLALVFCFKWISEKLLVGVWRRDDGEKLRCEEFFNLFSWKFHENKVREEQQTCVPSVCEVELFTLQSN